MMVTNAVLGGIADTVAQSITAVRERALRKNPRDETVAYELDRKDPFTDRELIPESKILPPPFDFERLTRFMAYGFGMAPLQFRWFRFLEKTFPITKGSAFLPAMKRVAFDQLIFAPFGMFIYEQYPARHLSTREKMGGISTIIFGPCITDKALGVACFFTVMTVAEGGGRRAVYQKLRDMYVPTLKANYAVWPAVQVINFRLMPVQFQLVSHRTLTIVVLLSCLYANTTVIALCFHRWYCLDCLPIPYQRCRRGNCTCRFPRRFQHSLGVESCSLEG